MRTIRPYRFGSDCEFGVMHMDKLWNYRPLSAKDILRVGNTTTFVGNDGHQQTGEIRPRPAHNVRQHVMDLADGVMSLQRWIKGSKRTKDAWIMALPYYGGETYGGHIHCSFTYQNPAQQELRALGLTWTGDRFDGNQEVPANQIAKLAALSQRMNETVNPDSFLRVMNHLVRPFECAVQPWDLRLARNETYGKSDDCRNQNSRPPAHFTDTYVHYEYRVPSTWLAHPELAYSYLGLAKLSMLNFEKILSTPSDGSRLTSQMASLEVFQERYRELLAQDPVVTSDLRGLGDRVDLAVRSREAWFQPMKPIAIEDWSRYAG